MPVQPRFYLKYPRSSIIKTWGLKALCHAYDWPSGLAGGGIIGITELGGGWRATDVETFCKGEGIPPPIINDVSVDGTTNSPGHSDADGEVALDIQVAAAAYSFATGKPATIRMYWAQDIAAATRAATKDRCDVNSISWGAPELQWGKSATDDMQAAALAATTAGMTVFAASGDAGADDGTNMPTTDVPAECPNVVSCGGTRLMDAGKNTRGLETRGLETVWDDDSANDATGGGYATYFPPQPWQAGVPTGPGRAVSDVSANADPTTGYHIFLNDQWTVVGGTSAVAPLYAGLFASFGKGLGFVTPKLWANHLAFNLITQGDNGYYRAGDSPRPPCGLGSPIGTKLAALFGAK